ncbi:MAG: hypothetical protein U0768_19505 [Anaerolineae bacterium]
MAGIAAIILFFTIGGFFGALNDLCNAVEAIMSAALAWVLHSVYRARAPRLSRFALVAAWVGAFIAVIGSVLVIFDVTGWYLAGLYTSVGYAMVGVWLFGLNYAALHSGPWPRRLAQWGLFVAVGMVIGFLAAPGIVGRIDDLAAAPWFVNLGLLNGLAWLILYPWWCIWLGRWSLSRRRQVPSGVAQLTEH